MCIDCRRDLWRGSEGAEVVGVGDCRGNSRGLQWAITASGDNICPLENVAMSRVAALLLSLGLAKLARRNLICIRKQSCSS